MLFRHLRTNTRKKNTECQPSIFCTPCNVTFQLRRLLTQLVYLLQTSNALHSKQVQMQMKQQASVISNMRRKIMQLESNVGMFSQPTRPASLSAHQAPCLPTSPTPLATIAHNPSTSNALPARCSDFLSSYSYPVTAL